ncbi:hypothetical protein LY76DRAFT_336142 [Colletotrichum caudatum]|nr:hypothetical protein LY76DRAFT_336142 [Colletotrichum caudatum]
MFDFQQLAKRLGLLRDFHFNTLVHLPLRAKIKREFDRLAKEKRVTGDDCEWGPHTRRWAEPGWAGDRNERGRDNNGAEEVGDESCATRRPWHRRWRGSRPRVPPASGRWSRGERGGEGGGVGREVFRRRVLLATWHGMIDGCFILVYIRTAPSNEQTKDDGNNLNAAPTVLCFWVSSQHVLFLC